MQVFLPKSLARLALLPVCYIGAQARGNFLTPIHTALSNQSWALTFSRSALCPAGGLGTKGASFTFPGLPLWVSSSPRQPRKPLSFSDIQRAADTSWESLKSFPKEATLQQMPIFRLHKAHIRFLLPFSLCSKPAVWKTAGSFVFKVQHCLASSHLELYSPGMHWGLFFPHYDRTPNHR